MTRGYWVRRMDATAPGPPSSIPDVSQPHRPTARSPETSERRTRRAWWIFAGSFFVLGLIAGPPPRGRAVARSTALVVGLVVVVGFAAIRHRQAVTELEIGRREEAESFARILSEPVALGLAGRDPRRHRRRAGRCHRRRPHRRRAAAPGRPRPRGDPRQRPAGRARIRPRPADRRPRGCRSTTEPAEREPVAIPVAARSADAVAAGGAAGSTTSRRGSRPRRRPGWRDRCRRRPRPGERQLIADRIAARAREVYGLTDTLAAPLTSEGTSSARSSCRTGPPAPGRRPRAGSSTAPPPKHRRPCRGPIRSGPSRRRPRPTP